MLKDTGHDNLWAHTAPAAPQTDVLCGALNADVAIIGAGYTGLSAALHLAQRGLKAVVLEARTIGHGGSGRNVGLVNAGMWVQPNDLIATQGPDWGGRLIAALGEGPADVFGLIDRFSISCEAERNGTLHMALGAAGLREITERAAQWTALGAPVSLLDAEAAAQATGTRAFAGALLDRRAGTIQPLAYARGLAEAALGLGAGIFTGSPVTGAEQSDGHWTLATPGGSLRAPWVIVATNAYSGLAPGFPFGGQQSELTLLPYFQFATRPLPTEIAAQILPGRQGCWDTQLVMTSFRMDRAGRLIFGSVGALDALSQGTQAGFAARSIRRLFPFVGDVELDHFWHGQIGMTADNLPKFHRPAPNVLAVNGYNGRGIAPGTVFGKAMAGLIAGDGEMPLPETAIGRAAFSGARTAFFRVGSQIAHFVGARLR